MFYELFIEDYDDGDTQPIVEEEDTKPMLCWKCRYIGYRGDDCRNGCQQGNYDGL